MIRGVAKECSLVVIIHSWIPHTEHSSRAYKSTMICAHSYIHILYSALGGAAAVSAMNARPLDHTSTLSA